MTWFSEQSVEPASFAVIWREVWNSVHAAAKKKGQSDKKAEATAFRTANGVVKKDFTSEQESLHETPENFPSTDGSGVAATRYPQGAQLPGTKNPRRAMSSTVMKHLVLRMAKYVPDQGRDETGKFSDGGQTPSTHAAVLKQSGYKFSHTKDGLGGKEDVWKHPTNGNTVHVIRTGRAMIQGPKVASGAVSTDVEGLKGNLR